MAIDTLFLCFCKFGTIFWSVYLCLDDKKWVSQCLVSIRDDPYWTSRENSLEPIELSSIKCFSLLFCFIHQTYICYKNDSGRFGAQRWLWRETLLHVEKAEENFGQEKQEEFRQWVMLSRAFLKTPCKYIRPVNIEFLSAVVKMAEIVHYIALFLHTCFEIWFTWLCPRL